MDFDFAAFAAADRLTATTNLSRPLKTVADAARIQEVLAVLGRQAAGWGVPAEGVPVANIRLNFYQGERLLGNLGLGRTFLTLHQRGSFWSKSVGPEVYAETMGLLDLQLGPRHDETE